MSLLLLFGASTQNLTGTGALSVTARLSGDNTARRWVSPLVQTGSRGPQMFGAIGGYADGQISHTGTGTLASVVTLSGAGVLSYAATGALLVLPTLSGSGDQVAAGVTWAGTGTLTPEQTLSGSGALTVNGDGALSVSATISADASTSAAPEVVAPSAQPAGGRVRRKRKEDERIDEELALVRRMLSGEDDAKPTPRKIVRRLRQAATHVEKAAREGSVAPAQAIEWAATLQAATEVVSVNSGVEAYLDTLAYTRALLDRLMAEAAEMDDEEALLVLL